MSKKKALIKETVVRRWGKLANIQPLTENWLEGTELYNEQDEDEEMEVGGSYGEEDNEDSDEEGEEDEEVRRKQILLGYESLFDKYFNIFI